MADQRTSLKVRVTGGWLSHCHVAIDNNPTPSYLSHGFGHSLTAAAFSVEFARKVPHSGVPEANPVVAA
jgi:hypothetical protein